MNEQGICLPFQWTVASISPEEMEAMCPTPKVYVPRPVVVHAPTAEELALAEFRKFSRPQVKQLNGRHEPGSVKPLETKAFAGF